MQKTLVVIMLILLPCLALAAAHSPSDPTLKQMKNYPLIVGNEEVNAPVMYPPYYLVPIDGGDDVVGDTVTIGTTWHENQHNGTIGRMVEKSSDGYLHFDWTNGTDFGAVNRHVYYQVIDPSGTQLWPQTGYPVESSQRAGYCTIDVDFDGIAFPAFHQQTTSSFHTAISTDFFPHSGIFITVEPEWLDLGNPLGEEKVIWPRIMFDRNQVMHVVSCENPLSGVAGDPQRHYYSAGYYDGAPNYTIDFTDNPANNSDFFLMAWTMTIAGDVATSDVSDRVAFAWTYPLHPEFPNPPLDQYSQYDNDVFVLIDDDGLDFHFDDAFNLTQFIPPDPSQLPDTLRADMDTLRAYTDLSLFIDMNNYVHCCFTTEAYYDYEGLISVNNSIVWHWSEEFPGEFQVLHSTFGEDFAWVDPGAWNYRVQRPMLGQDPSTGDLYAMFQKYDCDTTALSEAGWPSGEIYMSKSEDDGLNWSEAINLTNTITPNGAPAGQCWSELTPSMAKLVDGTCHIMYVMDRDAGFVFQTEGTWTFNEVKYHSVDVDLIPASPLVPQWPYDPEGIPFHVEHGPIVGIPGAGRYVQPEQFGLDQNYPNPFNPATTINFALNKVSEVTLKVYNLAGEEVAEVTSGTYGTGQHSVTFDGSNLASGMYIYKLEAGASAFARKMLLLK